MNWGKFFILLIAILAGVFVTITGLNATQAQEGQNITADNIQLDSQINPYYDTGIKDLKQCQTQSNEPVAIKATGSLEGIRWLQVTSQKCTGWAPAHYFNQ